MNVPSNPDRSRDDAPLGATKGRKQGGNFGPHLSARPGEALVQRSLTIDQPRATLYAFWRDFENLPRFMHNIRRVTVLDQSRSHWIVEAPADKTVEWDASITEDVPDERLAWKSEEGASLHNSGVVEFKDSPEGRGTVVTVTLAYDPPGGTMGQWIAKLYHKEPKIQARRDLRRFKQLMETGEIAITDPPYAAPRA